MPQNEHKVRDVLHFLDTEVIEHRNTTNTLAWEQFIEELDLQEQINEAELDSAFDINPNSNYSSRD